MEITKRQTEILTLMQEGKRPKEIGVELGISHKTVENIIYLLKKKFPAKNQVQLVKDSILLFKNNGTI